MAAPQTGHGSFAGFEHCTDGLLAAKDSALADERQMYTLLWLCPHVSSLTSALVEKLEESWDYGCAFLLDEILELQVIYRDYLGKATSTGSALGDSALLSSEDATRITRVLSFVNLAYRPDSFDVLISRELQFKVLASSLILSNLLGTVSCSETLFDEVRKGLVKQLDYNLKIRSAAVKSGGCLLRSFGQEDLYIRWALDSLSGASYDYHFCMLLQQKIAIIFFGGDQLENIDLTRELAPFRVFEEYPDISTRTTQLQYGLYHLALSAVSLARYSRTLEDQDARKIITDKSKQIAVHIVAKVELLLQNELARLQRLFESQRAGTDFRIKEGTTYFEPGPGETNVAFDLLHIATYLATEFGALKCFRIIGKLCNDYIEQLPVNYDLRPLTLKAMEVLLSIRQATSGLSKLNNSGSIFSPRRLQVTRSLSRLQRELDVSKALFVARKETQVHSTRFAVDELRKQHQRISMTSSYCARSTIVDSFQMLSSTQLDHKVVRHNEREADGMPYQETVGSYKSMTKEADDYSDSLYTPRSPNSASSTLASPEPPLYSDIDNQLDDYQEMLKISNLGTSEVREGFKHEERPRKGSGRANNLHHPNVPPLALTKSAASPYAIVDTIQELPTESPDLAHAQVQPHCEIVGTPSSSTLPNLDHLGARSPSLPGQPITPLTPDIPSPLMNRAPWPKGMSSKSSYGSLNMRPANLQEQQVEVEACPARKIKFLNSRKRADYVSLSPDCTYAAFVFSDQVQVCRNISDWEGTGSLETQVMLKSEKKAGKFTAACLSDTHLVAISDKQIQICNLTPLKLSRTSLNVRFFSQDVCATCLAISPTSKIIAVGQRVKAAGSGKGPPRYYAAIQIYSIDLTPETILMCHTAGDKEFPRHISFYDDGQALLYSNNKTFGLWKRGVSGWTETALGNLEARGPGAKGITSITPIALWASGTSSLPGDLPSSALRYYIVTSSLSSIAEDTASYTASVNSHPATKAPVPWCEHLYRSAVSPDGRLAAFLTDLGRLKLANLVSSNGNPALRMRNIPNHKVQAKKEAEANNAGTIGIRQDCKGYIVTMVDRHGTIINVRVIEAQKTPSTMNGHIDIPSKVLSKNIFSGTVVSNIPELPDNTLPIRELAAPYRFGHRQ